MEKTLDQNYKELLEKQISLLNDYNKLATKFIALQNEYTELKLKDFNLPHICIHDNTDSMIQTDLLLGNISRINLTNDLNEIDKMEGFAISRIKSLSNFHKLKIMEKSLFSKEQNND